MTSLPDPTHIAPSRDGAPVADPPRPLPTARLLVSFGVLLGLFTAGAWGLGRIYGWLPETVNGVVAGGITSAGSVLLSIMAMQPWKPRPAADWALFWLGSATIRILFTPLALFSVYSATLLPGPAVLLGGAAAFFAALVVETTVIARAVLQASRSPRDSAPSPARVTAESTTRARTTRHRGGL